MQKRGGDLIIVLLLISFLSIGLSSASSCRIASRDGATKCGTNPGENIIMGLSDVNNAHGQVWNASSYGFSSYSYVICCDFYASGVSPNNCNGNNKIIGLSSITNAHAETPNLILYTTPVCFGDLSCRYSVTSCDSANGEVDVLNLSSITNAHIGTGTGFQTAICCKGTSNVIGPSCDLTDATWDYSSTLEGGRVNMIVKSQGNNCPPGVSVNFSIYQDKGVLPAVFMTSYIGYFSNLTWVADLPSGTTSANLFFKAQTIISHDIFSSKDGTGNKTLSVSQQPVGFCSSKSLCSDYQDQQNCSSDSTLCTPPRATYDPKCDPSHKDRCSCMWNADTGKCSLSVGYSASGMSSCNNGFNLCYNSAMSIYYCYPALACPTGDEILPNGVCDTKDGCYSSDCTNGMKASCAGSATCSSGICSVTGQAPQNTSGCDNGYTLCYKNGLNFCYPGTTCLSGENPVSNNNGTCDPGEGCSSSDCGGLTGGSPTKLDSCLIGSYCYHGKCFSPTATTGTCVYDESSTNCTDGQRSFIWTVEWKGTGNIPSDCENGSKVIPCAAQIELPFFETYQILGVIILIILIYLLYAFRKKIFRKKHHSRRR